MRTEALTSAKNPLIKNVRRAIARGALTDDGHCIAEGFNLLEEALRSDCAVNAVIVSDSIRATVATHVRGLNELRVYTLSDTLFREMATTESTQGVIALVRPPVWTLDQVFRGNALVVILDGIQEPGNAGAIVRGAEAFGGSGVVFLKGTVNPYNPKSLRASAGSLFRLPCAVGLEEGLVRAACEQKRVALLAAMPGSGTSVIDVDLRQKCAFVIGSEGRGVSPDLARRAVPVRIPTTGVESLNAAVAAGILFYEARRQRMSSEPT